MAKSSFEAYVRSGRLQKAFDAGVQRATQEAKALSLRAPVRATGLDQAPLVINRAPNSPASKN